MDMQVENNLPRRLAIVLHYAHSLCFHAISDCVGKALGDPKQVRGFRFWYVVDVGVVFFGNHQGVSDVDWAVAQKRHHRLVFVHEVGGGLFLDYFAEDAVFRHGIHLFQRVNSRVVFNRIRTAIIFMETLVDDIGSFPLPAGIKRDDYARAYELARDAIADGKDPEEDVFVKKTFGDTVVSSFKRKLDAGLDVVNFPQAFSGLRQVGDAVHAAMERGSFVVDEKMAFLPEIYILNKHAKELCEEYGKKILLRVSIFGPIEQYLHEVGATVYPDVLEGFAQTINLFAKSSILNSKYIETKVISIDEPSLGHSPFTGTPEQIQKTLQTAYSFSGPIRQIHLHFASGIYDLLAVKGLEVLSFEYAASPKNIGAVSKAMLDGADKQIRVGIARTDLDAIWAELYEKGITEPNAEQLVEPVEAMQKRFRAAKEKYGERMTFTGPDCGLGSWPSQDAASLVLKRSVDAAKTP
jgi:5-methyltetrahydropteroyltriglutamate--homocysteine methyltransferase